MAKRKAVLVMREASSDVGTANIGGRVRQRLGLAHQVGSISSDPEGVVVLPDDDVYHSEGNQGAFKQPIVQAKSVSKPTPNPSSSGGFSAVSHH